MNKKILLIIVAVTALAVPAFSQTTNDTVQLTADQIAKLDTGINNLIPLLPASFQPYIVKFIAIIGLLGIVGRAASGFLRGGTWGVITGLFGGHNGPLNTPPANIAKGASGLVRPLVILAVASLALCFTGCHSTQVLETASGSGFKGSVAVPIPMSGGSTLIGAELTVGAWKSSTVVQPVATNQLHTPAIALNQETHGAQNLSGQVGGSTNGAAGIVAGEADKTSLVTESGSVTATNSVLQGQPK